MIDLYALTSPNVQKVYIMLEECGLPYKEHFVDVWKGDQYAPEFSKINPNNKIPAIVDHEGPGGKPYTVFEFGRDPDVSRRKDRQVSAQGHGQELRCHPVADDPDDRRRADVRPVDAFQVVRAEEATTIRWRATPEVKRLYELLEKRLGQAPFLGGQEYSIADIATFPWTRNHDAQGVKWEDNPNLARWFNAI